MQTLQPLAAQPAHPARRPEAPCRGETDSLQDTQESGAPKGQPTEEVRRETQNEWGRFQAKRSFSEGEGRGNGRARPGRPMAGGVTDALETRTAQLGEHALDGA